MWPRRDRFEHFAGKIMRAPSEVINGKYSDHHLFPVHDRQTPHAFIFHQANRVFAVLIFKT
jgi:hypothetical protein